MGNVRETHRAATKSVRSWVELLASIHRRLYLEKKNNNGPHTQSLISFNNSHKNNPLFRCFFVFFPRHKFCFLLFLWHGCGEGSSRLHYDNSTDKIRKTYKTKWFNKCQRGKTETRATCSPRMKSCWTCLWHSSSLRSIGWRWTANPVKGSLFLWFDGPGAEEILSLLSSLDVVKEPRASVMWSTGPERKKNTNRNIFKNRIKSVANWRRPSLRSSFSFRLEFFFFFFWLFSGRGLQPNWELTLATIVKLWTWRLAKKKEKERRAKRCANVTRSYRLVGTKVVVPQGPHPRFYSPTFQHFSSLFFHQLLVVFCPGSGPVRVPINAKENRVKRAGLERWRFPAKVIKLNIAHWRGDSWRFVWIKKKTGKGRISIAFFLFNLSNRIFINMGGPAITMMIMLIFQGCILFFSFSPTSSSKRRRTVLK